MSTTINGDTGIIFPDASTQSKAVSQATPFAVTASAIAGAELQLPEATANGVNYVAVKAPNALAANTTFTLPAADGTNGQFLQTNGTGTLAFASVPATTPGGTTGQIQFNNAGVFGGVTAVPAANGGTGLTAPGTAGNLLTSNGTTWVSQAAPPSGPTLQAVASGTLANGSRVIVNADETVSVVVESTAPSSPAVAGTGTYLSAAIGSVSCAYDVNAQRVVVAYQLTSNGRGFAVVGTVVGNSITFGTPVQFSPNNSVYGINAVYHTAQQKVVILYINSNLNNRMFAKVGTVSGSSITFGDEAEFAGSTGGGNLTAVYHTAQQVIVALYPDSSNSQIITAIAGTVSGTSITFNYGGQAFGASLNGVGFIASAYDTNAQRVLVAYRDNSDTQGKCTVLSASGTTLTVNGFSTFNPASTTSIGVTYATNAQRIVIAYKDEGNSSFGTVRVGTISGGSISFGSEIVYRSSTTDLNSIGYDDAAQKIVIFFDGGAITGLVSGSSVTFGSPSAIITGGVNSNRVPYNPVAKKLIVPFTFASLGQVALVSSVGSNMTAGNFIGFSDGTYSNGQTATIQLVGSINAAQSGLTTGLSYYVQYDGTLNTIPGTPSVFAGIAIAANKIIVKG
jgi:hypothetical protein